MRRREPNLFLSVLIIIFIFIKALSNIVVFGLTNRRELIEPALLRPGRFEVQVEVGLPDQAGREVPLPFLLLMKEEKNIRGWGENKKD